MPSISGRTNPTGRKRIARKHVSVVTQMVNGTRTFELSSLDLASYGFPAGFGVVVIATAGNTRVRVPVGTTTCWSKGPYAIDGLDESHILRFRLLVSEPTTARIVGLADRIRPVGDGYAESLIPIVTADLGELVWRVKMEDEDAVIQVNVSVFPTGASAENNVTFQSLVLPEALRQVMQMLAECPAKLTDDESAWRDWATWLTGLGCDLPTEAMDKDGWVSEVVDRFCNLHRFATGLRNHAASQAGQA